ncbi:MAG TPA: tRNA methyl transferase PRC-barrel domain-containing protein, partial [Solirubrobacteraceae bacterium]|nr:tRNA methyl transferase PRC-barrel domain-containing protein [Solirubrobacteraceae bacterium]
DAARVGAEEIAAELGGLSPAKRHAAELAADALHRALGGAARARAGLAPCAGRTLVAMSGGVDSAVAALLTARAGEEVVGVTLELWADPENDGERSCCSAQAVRGARALAHGLGLPHLSIDLREEFRAGVVEGWLAGYAHGHTPNPCVRCNGNVRLDAMLDLASRLGAGRLVTGHYARVHRDGPAGSRGAQPDDPRPGDAGEGGALGDGMRGGHSDGAPGDCAGETHLPLLRMARDPVKDQSYVLAGLDPRSLARLRFPLGGMTKAEVREIAEREGLAVARKPDSQDLCFLAGTGLERFLARHGDVAGGDGQGSILDRAGRPLGTHRGAHAFTIGQRHGLGLSGPEPLYVLGTDTRANTVTVGPREALLTRTVAVRDVTLRRPGARVDGVKVRSRGQRYPCRVERDPGPGVHPAVEVHLEEPIERTAPGQIACLYEGDVILGYGTIS